MYIEVINIECVADRLMFNIFQHVINTLQRTAPRSVNILKSVLKKKKREASIQTLIVLADQTYISERGSF